MDRETVGDLVEALGDWTVQPGPLYRSLADAFERVIGAGVLARGDRLPSERQLASALVLSRSTVIGAYDALRARGLIESRLGSGSYVAGQAPRRTDSSSMKGGGSSLRQRLLDRPERLISLGSAVGEPPPELAEAVRAVSRIELPDLVCDAGYFPRGLPALTQALSEHYTVLGLPTSPREILVTNGATQAIGLIAQLYLRRGSRVVVESPGWPGCLDLLRAVGARPLAVPLDEEGIDPAHLGTVLAREKPDLVFVMPTYHNPTGTFMSARRRRQVAALADQHQTPLVEDVSYAADPPGDVVAPLEAHGKGAAEKITVSGLAKTVWPGLRIGWVRAPAEVVDRLSRLKALADMGTSVLDQAVAARLVPALGPIAERRAAHRRTQLATLGGLLETHLPDWRWRPPAGGSALWVELPGVDARAFAAVALRHGVEVVPGRLTDPSGAHDAFIRVPFGVEPDVLEELVARLATSWRVLHRHGPLGPERSTVL